jgi:hypothetical protein
MDVVRVFAAVTLCVVIFAACIRRSPVLHPGDQRDVPRGLDSAGTAKWVAAQRAACRGRLVILVDEMPQFDLDGRTATYRTPLVGVQCGK